MPKMRHLCVPIPIAIALKWNINVHFANNIYTVYLFIIFVVAYKLVLYTYFIYFQSKNLVNCFIIVHRIFGKTNSCIISSISKNSKISFSIDIKANAFSFLSVIEFRNVSFSVFYFCRDGVNVDQCDLGNFTCLWVTVEIWLWHW